MRQAGTRLLLLLAALLFALLLTGCVEYLEREDGTEEPSVEATAEENTTAADTVADETAFPNEPEDGHTKRY